MITVLRVRVQWAGPSAPLLSTFYFDPDPVDQSAVEACHIATATFWNSVRDQIGDELTYVVLQDVTELSLSGEQEGSWTAANVAAAVGQDTGDPLPYQTQGLVGWRTGSFIGGRELRGRTFIPAPTEAKNTSGIPTGTYTSDILAAANVLIGTAGAPFGVWSRKNAAFSQATSAVVSPGWAVLRSRR